MILEGLFDGGVGKGLLVAIGVLAGVVAAFVSRIGKRKVDDIKRRIP
jgi:hypothetical protein